MRQSHRARILEFLLGALAFVVSVQTASALDLTVNTVADDPTKTACAGSPNDCSLRGAILRANGAPGPHTISLPTGFYRLTTTILEDDAAQIGDLDILEDVTINGVNQIDSVISGAEAPSSQRPRIFEVHSGGRLTLRDLSVRRSGPGDFTYFGGAVRAEGSLTLERVSIRLSDAGYGGGLYVTGTALIRDSTVTGNIARLGGGITIVGTSNAVVTITNTTISDNLLYQPTGSAGGGMYIDSTNHTIALNNVTIAKNAGSLGGGIFNQSQGATPLISNSIIANNPVSSPFNTRNCFGAIDSQGHNLVFGGFDTCAFNVSNNDIVNTGDPVLGPTQGNGGPTATQALGSGSAALDRGSPLQPGSGGTACERADARGVARPQNADGLHAALCDIGAFELGCPLPRPNVLLSVSQGGTNTLMVTLSAGYSGIARIRGVPARSSGNIRTDVAGGTDLPSSFNVIPNGNPGSVQLALHRSDNAGAGTLAFIVTDGCGDWETFAGGGPQAWSGGSAPVRETHVQHTATPTVAPATPTIASATPTVASATPTATRTAIGTPIPGAACASFASHAAAQAHLRSDPTDPLVLDRSRNGIACEGADGAGFVNPPLDHTPVHRP
ncbi:MAG: choice-of-anchor Q domain-containing protein [Chloroflexota bacterium]